MIRSGESILEVDQLSKRFAGVVAVNKLSFTVGQNEIVGLVGPNGSGKTTTFNLISGLIPADDGKVVFASKDITRERPYRIARAGLVRTFQLTRVFNEMTVFENLATGPGSSREVVEDTIGPLLKLVGLEDHIASPASQLSIGQQKLLEMIRAASLGARLFLLDEPFAGVNPTMERKLVGLIRELHKGGATFLIIDHEIPLIAELCNYVYVMDYGEKLAEGSPDEVRSDPKTLEAYFGKGYIARTSDN